MSRCRACGAPTPRRVSAFPAAEELARLEELLPMLIAAAAEFMACSAGPEPGTPVEFVQWLRPEVERLHSRSEPAGRPARKAVA